MFAAIKTLQTCTIKCCKATDTKSKAMRFKMYFFRMKNGNKTAAATTTMTREKRNSFKPIKWWRRKMAKQTR